MRGVIGPEDGGWGGHDPERAGSHQLDQHAVTGLIFDLFSREIRLFAMHPGELRTSMLSIKKK